MIVVWLVIEATSTRVRFVVMDLPVDSEFQAWDPGFRQSNRMQNGRFTVARFLLDDANQSDWKGRMTD